MESILNAWNFGKEHQCWLASKYSPTQPQWQQRPVKSRPIGAKATSAVTKVNHLRHCILSVHFSCSGNCVVATAQRQVI